MRLIDADELKEEIALMWGDKNHITESVHEIIDNAPTVEPTYISDMPDDKVKDLQELAIDYGEGIAVFERKRPQGEWIENLDSRNDEMQASCYCSECGASCYCATDKFCHECGAEMQKGGAE